MTVNLLHTELDLATDQAGRDAVRRQIVEQFKASGKLVEEQFKTALIGDSTDLLEARASRLHAEIDLLLEMSHGK